MYVVVLRQVVIFLKFIYSERERERGGERERREKGRERIPSRRHTIIVDPYVGLKLTNL